jgi:predicted phage terminase large subunit-like protein
VNDTASLELQLKAVKRLLALQEARDSLLHFMRLTMPDPEDLDDPDLSRYEITPLARLLCEIMEKVERGEMKRVAVSVGPQMGKSQILSRGAPAWFMGRNPYRNLMLGTYNQDFASEFGFEVRTITESPMYKAVFPEFELLKGGAAKDLMVTAKGGKAAFVGVGGSGTGKPADFFIVDDPIRNDDDAQSSTYRDRLWKWFNSVVFTRTHGKSGIIVVHTRWHQDDLIGRLVDPDHPERNKEYKGIADKWTYINLPAVVEDKKLAKALNLNLEPPTNPDVKSMFGSGDMSSIWPERKPLEFLAEAKRMDPRTFGALYMGKPAPEDGEYFKSEWLLEYDRKDMPKELRMYGASDHAVSTKQGRDYTVMGCVGVDSEGDIWVMPDLVWDRMETDRTVEELLLQFARHRPQLWWMESELISKSFGPFLRKRMQEEGVYVTIDTVTPSKDKMTRARAIQGRMAMQKIHFPRFAHWWPDAKAQILRFPYSANDDMVDWLAHIGQGLLKEVRPSNALPKGDNVVEIGGIDWIMRRSLLRARKAKAEKSAAGW